MRKHMMMADMATFLKPTMSKNSKRFRKPFASLILLMITTASAEAALVGSTVTGTGFFPDLSTVFSGPLTATVVDPGIEFPMNSLGNAGSIEITDTQIIWNATRDAQYGTGAFNGFVLQFTGAPTITNVTMDVNSTLPAVSIVFSANEVQIDLGHPFALAGQQTILNITTAPVPLPAPFVLLGSVLGSLGFVRRRFV